MPWNKDDEGGGQGPWSQGPWGGKKNPDSRNPNNWGGKRGGGGPGNLPPDLEELVQRAKDQFRNLLPGGGRLPWLWPVALVAALVAFNSVHQVQPDERGVVLRFGAYSRTVDPGLQFALWPIETMEQPRVGAVQKIAIGMEANEGQMLTSDKNIISVPFTVQWRIGDPKNYLFNVAAPERMIRALAQSAMREVAAQSKAQDLLSTGKDAAAAKVLEISQRLLDAYDAGVILTAVNLGDVQPPQDVADAFADVVRADQDKKRFENEALLYRNKRLQQADGESARLVQEAEGYKTATVAEAKGNAARFLSVYGQYKNAKDVTRQRIFIETMEGVLSQSNKVIIENGSNGAGVLPYLPLPAVQAPAAAPVNSDQSN
jgi:modulator of FtsH protease HflK